MNDEDLTIWDCPSAGCNGTLIKRKNKTDGSKFIGCTNYPKCTYTQPDETQNDDEGYPDGLPDSASVWK